MEQTFSHQTARRTTGNEIRIKDANLLNRRSVAAGSSLCAYKSEDVLGVAQASAQQFAAPTLLANNQEKEIRI